MPESPNQKITNLALVVKELETQLDDRTKRFEKVESELNATRDQLQDLRAKLATLEERCAGLQRLSDRGWGLWQALLVLAISIAASAVTQLALRK